MNINPATARHAALATMSGTTEIPRSLADVAKTRPARPAQSLTELMGAAKTGHGGPLVLNPPGSPSVTGLSDQLTDVALEQKQPVSLAAAQIDSITRDIRLDDVVGRLEPAFKQVADKTIGRVFASHDADNDGRLTGAELRMGEKRLNAFDLDGDKALNASELRAALKNDLGRAMKADPGLDVESYADAWLKALAPDEPTTLAPTANAPANAAAPRHATLVEAASSRRERLSDMAKAIGERLDQAGFTRTPPLNIRSLVDSLGFDPASTRSMMNMLSARYPNGLGLNVLG